MTKTRKVNNITAFSAYLAPLSNNIHQANVPIDGVEHQTAEHAYQYTKCKFHGNQKRAQQVCDTPNPYTAIQIGNAVGLQSNAWNARREV